MTTARTHSSPGRRPSIRTVVVRISRKLRATYRLRTGPLFSKLLLTILAVLPGMARALPQVGVV